MKNKGYNVKELDGEANISNETLKNAHILVIPEANNPFKEKEQQAIVNFVKRGVVSYLFQTTTMQIEI